LKIQLLIDRNKRSFVTVNMISSSMMVFDVTNITHTHPELMLNTPNDDFENPEEFPI